MHFKTSEKILFRHCDPAGIVFYPRYFELVNDTVEAFFADVLGWPMEELHKTHAGPTVTLEARFMAMSRHGDRLDMRLTVEHLGTSSLRLRTEGWCADEQRLSVVNTMVCVDPGGKPTAWPKGVRTRLKRTLDTIS